MTRHATLVRYLVLLTCVDFTDRLKFEVVNVDRTRPGPPPKMTSLYAQRSTAKRARPSGDATSSAGDSARRSKSVKTATRIHAAAEDDEATVVEGGSDDRDGDYAPEPSESPDNSTVHFREDNTRRRSGRRKGDQQPSPPTEHDAAVKPVPKGPTLNKPASEVVTRWSTESGGLSLAHVDVFVDTCNSLSFALGRRLLFMRTPDSDLIKEVNCELAKVSILLGKLPLRCSV